MSNNKYIDLKVNGRLFPSWVLLNFKEYKLPPSLRVENDDPCLRKTKLELRKYQEFISSFLSYNSAYKDILLYQDYIDTMYYNRPYPTTSIQNYILLQIVFTKKD